MCAACQRASEQRFRDENKESLSRKRAARSAKQAAYRKEYNATHRGEILLREAGRRAKRRGLQFDLDQHEEAIIKRVNTARCEMTGLPLCLRNTKIFWDSPSLHRVEPKKGYVITNVKVVCFLMNSALGSWGEPILKKVMAAWSSKEQ